MTRTSAGYTPKEGRWVRSVQSAALKFGIAEQDCIFKPSKVDAVGRVDAHLVGTQSLVAWVSSQSATNQSSPATKDLCVRWLASITEKAMMAHVRLSTTATAISADCSYVTITQSGDILDWDRVIGHCCNGI